MVAGQAAARVVRRQQAAVAAGGGGSGGSEDRALKRRACRPMACHAHLLRESLSRRTMLHGGRCHHKAPCCRFLPPSIGTGSW